MGIEHPPSHHLLDNFPIAITCLNLIQHWHSSCLNAGMKNISTASIWYFFRPGILAFSLTLFLIVIFCQVVLKFNSSPFNLPNAKASLGGVSKQSDQVKIYPVPFENEINIELNENAEPSNTRVVIFNVLGESVLNEEIKSAKTKFAVAELKEGIYFYNISRDNKTVQSGRIVKGK